MDALTPTSETSENVLFFTFIPSFISFGIRIYVQYFFDAPRNQTSIRKCLLELFKKRPKIHERICRERT